MDEKKDISLLKKLIGDFLINNHIEIISIEGKNKLHFFADHKILLNLIKMGFKFLIILDKDEGNQKIIDSIPDDEIKENILLLPVREIENLYINPDLIIETTKIVSNKLINEKDLRKNISEITKNVISKDHIDNIIRKSFLDKIPFSISFRDIKEILDYEGDNTDWLDHFFIYFQNKYWINDYNKEKFNQLLEERIDYYQNISEKEKWKIFPGKKIRPLILEKLKDQFDISIPLERLEENMKNNSFIQDNLISEIQNRLTLE